MTENELPPDPFPPTTQEPKVLFHEPGASWLWVLAGPVAAGSMAGIQASGGGGFQPLVPGMFLVLVTGFLAIQIKAARIHTSVLLTPTTLKQGTEFLQVDEIVQIYPEAEGRETPKWQSARALGELTGVPRRRTGIGLRLEGKRTAQAWARKHKDLRAALVELTGLEPT
jgi:hypothetical protein